MPTNEELIKKLGKDLRDYVDERIGRVIDLEIRLSAQIEEQRAQIVMLAEKLRDVTTALVQADGAIITDLQDLRTFVMNSAFGESYDAELVGIKDEFTPPGLRMDVELPEHEYRFDMDSIPPEQPFKNLLSRARSLFN